MPCVSPRTCTSTCRPRLDVRLAEHGRVAERGRRLGGAASTAPASSASVADDAHAATAAARRRLDQQRKVGRGDVAGRRLGQHRARRPPPSASWPRPWRPSLHRPRRRADPGQSRVDHLAGELGVLGEEPVARVHGVRAGAQRGRDEQVAAQVGLGRRAARAAAPRRRPRARTAAPASASEYTATVSMPELAAGPEDPAGDLAPVGHEEPVDRRLTRLTSGRRRSRRRPATGRCSITTGRCPARSGCRAGR